MIQSKYVLKHGNLINVDITAYLIKNIIAFNKEYYSILDVAKMFKSKIKMLPSRRGERYASALTKMNLNNKVYKYYGKISLKNYVNGLISRQK